MPENVEARAGYVTGGQGVDQSIVVNDGAPPDIDDVSAAFHLLKFVAADDGVGLGSEGEGEDEEVGTAEDAGQVGGSAEESQVKIRVEAGGGVAFDAQKGSLEWLQASGQSFADSPHPQDADGLASQTHALRLAPDAGLKRSVCLGIFPGEGEH